MKGVTRGRPQTDRIACPWLVTRFIGASPDFLYVPGGDVMRIAAKTGAIPHDVSGVELGHLGDKCSFDAFIDKYRLDNPALNGPRPSRAPPTPVRRSWRRKLLACWQSRKACRSIILTITRC